MRSDQLEAHSRGPLWNAAQSGEGDITASGYHRLFGGSQTLSIPPAPPKIPLGYLSYSILKSNHIH